MAILLCDKILSQQLTHDRILYTLQDNHVLLNDTKNPCWIDVHNEMRCLPYMFFIGAPKCGTTDLYKRFVHVLGR